MLSPRLLEVLRRYYRATRPQGCYLFPSWRREHHLCTTSLQLACREAAVRAHIAKRVTVHTLRHYAEFRTMPSKSLPMQARRQVAGIPEKPVAVLRTMPSPKMNYAPANPSFRAVEYRLRSGTECHRRRAAVPAATF